MVLHRPVEPVRLLGNWPVSPIPVTDNPVYQDLSRNPTPAIRKLIDAELAYTSVGETFSSYHAGSPCHDALGASELEGRRLELLVRWIEMRTNGNLGL